MKKFFTVFLFIFSICFSNEKVPYFNISNKWQIADPSSYGKLIKIGYIKKGFSKFNPSINLASEKTNLSLDEYTQLAKKEHETDIDTIYEVIEKIPINGGYATISFIDKKIRNIELKLAQMIYLDNKDVYVITAASEKGKFYGNYPEFLKIFRSFRLVNEIFDVIDDDNEKIILSKEVKHVISDSKYISKKHLERNLTSFEKKLDKKYLNHGNYFKYLLLEKIAKDASI